MTKDTQTPTAKIFDNILFLAEVFGDQADKDIPRLPVLEMARYFDLVHPRAVRAERRRRRDLFSECRGELMRLQYF